MAAGVGFTTCMRVCREQVRIPREFEGGEDCHPYLEQINWVHHRVFLLRISFSSLFIRSVCINIRQYRQTRRPPCWLPGRSWEGVPHSCERISSAPLTRKASPGHGHRILIFIVLNQSLVVHGSHLVWLSHNLFNLAGGRHPVSPELAERNAGG
jgi:hypothetical protein